MIPIVPCKKMARMETATEYKEKFMQRVRQARERVGYNQTEIAELLGLKQDVYKQYETRSLLPHRLIGKFCLITNVDPVWLLTGAGRLPKRQHNQAA